MDVGSFNPETAVFGGMSLITIHLVIMSQIRKFAPDWKYLNKFFDLLNYPVAFVLLLFVHPPWPIYSGEAWGAYIQFSISTAALASVAAGKVISEDKKKIQELEIEKAKNELPPGAEMVSDNSPEPQPEGEAVIRPIVRKV